MTSRLYCSAMFSAIAIFLFANARAQSFSWAQEITGIGSSSASGTRVQIATTDVAGNLYSIGYFGGTADFDAGLGTYNLTAVSNLDMFIMKEDATGNLIWVKQVAGLSSGVCCCLGRAIDVDQNGNVFIAGIFRDSFDFDPGPATYKLNSNGGPHSFILKLDALGNFVWVGDIGTQIPAVNVQLNAAKRNKNGDLYFAALVNGNGTTPIDVDPTAGVYNITPTISDLLLEKLDSNGNFIWAKLITGTNGKAPTSIDFDSASNVFISGHFLGSADFDPGPAVYTLTATPGPLIAPQDIFIASYDSAGNFNWARSVGNNFDDQGIGGAVDPYGNVLVTGYFSGTADFDPGSGVYNLTSNSTRSLFTLKLRNNGDFAWAKMAGAPVGLFYGGAVATDSTGNVYTAAGLPGGCDLDPGPGFYYAPAGVAVQKLDSSGNFVWARSWQADIPGWIGLDHNNDVYTTGSFSGPYKDFDPGPGQFLLNGISQGSGFIEKLCQNPAAISIASTAETSCTGDTVLLSATAMAGASYRWYKNGIALPDSTSTIKVTTSGTYIAEAGNGCAGYDTVTVTFWSPYHPDITILGINQQIAVGQIVFLTALVTNGVFNDTIDWYKNGMLDPNYHSTTFNYYKSPGTDTIIAVVHKRNNPCYFSDTSNMRIISEPVGIAALSKQNIAVFPNPFSQNITIEGLDINDKVLLTDLRGVKLQEWQARQRSENFVTKDLAPGFYIYKIADEEGRVKQYGGMVKE